MDKDWIFDGFGEQKEAPPPDDSAPVELPGGYLVDARPDPEPEEPSGDPDEEAEERDEDASDGPDPAELLRKARFMRDVDRPRDALRVLQELTDWYPRDHDGWCEVARAFQALGDKTRAHRAADLAIEADPYSAGGYAVKCSIYLQNGDAGDALKTAEKGSEMTYRDPEVERWKVRAWLAGGKHAEARQYLTERSELPQDAETHAYWGDISRLSNDLPNADVSYRRAISLDAGCGPAWSGLAAVQLKQERHDDAVQCIHRAVQLNQGEGDVASRTLEVVDGWVGKRFSGSAGHGITMMLISIFCVLGPATLFLFPAGLIWYLVARPHDRARRDRVLEQLPRDLREYYQVEKRKDVKSTWSGLGCLLGLILGVVALIGIPLGLYKNFGFDGMARVLLLLTMVSLPILWNLIGREDAVKEREIRYRFPGDPWVPDPDAEADLESEKEADAGPPPDWEPDPIWAGRRFLFEGKPAAAQEQARAVLKSDPERVDALALFSSAALMLGEFEPGLAAAKSARSLEPEDLPPHALVWAHLAALGRMEEAVANSQEESAIAEEAGDYLVWLVRLLFEAGQITTARAISELIQRAYPGSSEPHEVEGEWAFQTGRWAESEAAFRRALAIEPESSSLLADLAWTLEKRFRWSEARRLCRQALAIDAEQSNARNLLERHVNIGLLAVAVITGLTCSLAATIPTWQGSTINRWMLGATLGGPLLAGMLVFLLVKPTLRRMLPGLLLDLEDGSGGSMDPWLMSMFGAAAALFLALLIHAIQAWTEIALHPALLGARWPGAATVSVFANLALVGVGALVVQLRRS